MNAVNEIKETYTLENFKEIANHGCSSGVCFKHIYYGDTVCFFDNYEDEITDYFRDNYDVDFLVKLFNEACADLSQYKNDVTWAYIEAVCYDVINDESLLQPAY